VTKNRIRYPPQQRRAADRAATEAIKANQAGRAKSRELAGTTNRLLKKTGIPHDHTAPLLASMA
jgi:hypothetical protein